MVLNTELPAFDRQERFVSGRFVTGKWLLLACFFLVSRLTAADTRLQLQGQVGYGYSFFGVAEGGSFNINPGTGMEVGALGRVEYRMFAGEVDYRFQTINDTHFGIAGRQYRTSGGGRMLQMEPRIGWSLNSNDDPLEYIFVYAGARYWNADYAYSRVGSGDYPFDDSMTGMGITLGARYSDTIRFAGLPWFWQAGMGFARAPVSRLIRQGQEQKMTAPGGVTPTLEAHAGWQAPRQRLALAVGCRYDVMVTRYTDKTLSPATTASIGNGALRFQLTAMRTLEL